MSCGGGHLGFPTGIKNTNFVEDLPMIIPGQFGFNYVLYKPCVFCSEIKFKMAATAGLSLTLTKNVKFVEDHPMNIHVQFGFNHICSHG
jgi:hypothetical protein